MDSLLIELELCIFYTREDILPFDFDFLGCMMYEYFKVHRQTWITYNKRSTVNTAAIITILNKFTDLNQKSTCEGCSISNVLLMLY